MDYSTSDEGTLTDDVLVRITLGLNTVEELDRWKPKWAEFDDVVCTIVDEYTMVSGVDAALSADDEILKHSKLFI